MCLDVHDRGVFCLFGAGSIMCLDLIVSVFWSSFLAFSFLLALVADLVSQSWVLRSRVTFGLRSFLFALVMTECLFIFPWFEMVFGF